MPKFWAKSKGQLNMGGRGAFSMSSQSSALSERTLSKSEIEGLIGDWSSSSIRFRDAISGRRDVGSYYTERAKKFDQWLDMGTYTGDLYRGITVDKSVADSFEVGQVIDQLNAPSSWSKTEKNALNFAVNDGNERAVVFVMQGWTNHGQDISKISRRGEEDEVAVSSKSKQLITDRKIKDGKIYLFLRERL